jgi:hypothetical protein
VEWVEKPVKCALSWAFVPSSVSTDVAPLTSTLAGRAPWTYLAAGPTEVEALVAGWSAPSSGCDESTVTDGVFGFNLSDFKPWCALSSSSGQGSFTVGTFRGVASAGIAITFVWACYHRAKRIVGDSGPNDPSRDVDGDTDAVDRSYDDDDLIDAYEAGRYDLGGVND